MRFLGLGLADPVPDANTIWTFREALTRAGFLAMGGQISDASIVAAPKQRTTDEEKREIKAGRVPEAWRRTLPSSPRRTATPAGR